MAATTTPTRSRLDAATIEAATPAGRDRVVDLVRVGAIAVVVLGHWLLAVVRWDHGLEGANLLALEPWTRRLTWIFQVMPLFFVAGGVANASSWESARRRGMGWSAWVHTRIERLLLPVVPLAVCWTVVLAVAWRLGADPAGLRTAGRLVAMPLWFLAVYLGVVAATPVMVRLHRRHPVGTMAALVGLAAVGDLSRAAGLPVLAWGNEAWVWLAAHQAGLWWRDGRLGRRQGWSLALAGAAGLVALTVLAGYPVSMVGGAGERSNMTPPSLPIVALAALQVGLLVLARPALGRLTARPGVWRVVVLGGGVAMTVYLWHLTALCLGVLGLVATGVFPQPATGTAAWWLLRPVWVALLLAVLAGLVRVWGRVEAATPSARSARPGPASAAWTLAAVVACCAGLTAMSVGGLPVAGRALALPLLGLGLPVVGYACSRSALLRTLRPVTSTSTWARAWAGTGSSSRSA